MSEYPSYGLFKKPIWQRLVSFSLFISLEKHLEMVGEGSPFLKPDWFPFIHAAVPGVAPGTEALSGQVRKILTCAQSNGGWRTDRDTLEHREAR